MRVALRRLLIKILQSDHFDSSFYNSFDNCFTMFLGVRGLREFVLFCHFLPPGATKKQVPSDILKVESSESLRGLIRILGYVLSPLQGSSGQNLLDMDLEQNRDKYYLSLRFHHCVEALKKLHLVTLAFHRANLFSFHTLGSVKEHQVLLNPGI